MQDLSNEFGESVMRECINHHRACDCREQYFKKLEGDYMLALQRFTQLRLSSKGTVLNEDGDHLYALIPLTVLNDPL